MRKATAEDITRYADMLAAMGTEPRLRITQLLLAAHPEGMVAGEIQMELGTSSRTIIADLPVLRVLRPHQSRESRQDHSTL